MQSAPKPAPPQAPTTSGKLEVNDIGPWMLDTISSGPSFTNETLGPIRARKIVSLTAKSGNQQAYHSHLTRLEQKVFNSIYWVIPGNSTLPMMPQRDAALRRGEVL